MITVIICVLHALMYNTQTLVYGKNFLCIIRADIFKIVAAKSNLNLEFVCICLCCIATYNYTYTYTTIRGSIHNNNDEIQ